MLQQVFRRSRTRPARRNLQESLKVAGPRIQPLPAYQPSRCRSSSKLASGQLEFAGFNQPLARTLRDYLYCSVSLHDAHFLLE
jgi:hypothetical protein